MQGESLSGISLLAHDLFTDRPERATPERRFGELSGHLRHRLRQADAAQLQAWSLNVLNAQSLNRLGRKSNPMI